jgi:hypothetical protein
MNVAKKRPERGTKPTKPLASTVSTGATSFIINVSETGAVFVGIVHTDGAHAGGAGTTISSLTLTEKEAGTLGQMLVKAAKVADRDGTSTAIAALDASAAESLGKVLTSAATSAAKAKNAKTK